MTLDNSERESSIFKDESKLDINFIPEKMPHREKELYLLSRLFLTLLTNPNSVSRKILITGSPTTGMTVTVKSFGKMLVDAAAKRGVKIKFVYIYCRKMYKNSNHKVLIRIMGAINDNFLSLPRRLRSPQDLWDMLLYDYLTEKNYHLLIVLDDVNYLINEGEDLFHILMKINDDLSDINGKQRISIIAMAKDVDCLSNLDADTVSTLRRNLIEFKPYTREEMFDILKYRTHLGFKENAVPDDIIEIVSELTHKKGDMRFGLNLLWLAGRIAEHKNLRKITTECIALATRDLGESILPHSSLG